MNDDTNMSWGEIAYFLIMLFLFMFVNVTICIIIGKEPTEFDGVGATVMAAMFTTIKVIKKNK